MAHIRRLAIVGLLVLGGCGTDPLTTIVDPVMTITNQWADASNSDHTFFFQADSSADGKNTGTFTGTETTPGGSQFPLTGNWAQGVVQFTVKRSSSVLYRATFTTDNPKRLDFDSSAGHLTLQRN